MSNSAKLTTPEVFMIDRTDTESTNSATGNPRNRCTLKPGHSLMDWIRLGSSGIDLTGTGGRIIPINYTELAKHNTRNDAWMAIRGKVFNVTRYMDFHPGGSEELMRGVGTDCTALFEKVHAWVNYDRLLDRCLIGPLKQTPKQFLNPSAKCLLPPVITSSNQKENLSIQSLLTKALTPTDICPKFDWTQQRNNITFYIYTNNICNPGLILQKKSGERFKLKVFVEHVIHVFDFELQESVEWPPKFLKLFNESGKLELSFNKIKTADNLWASYGKYKLTKILRLDDEEQRYDFEVVRKSKLNHNSFEMILKPKTINETSNDAIEYLIMLLPIGFHIDITVLIQGNLCSRSYTPIEELFLCDSPFDSETKKPSFKYSSNLNFIIKTYKNGLMSHCLRNINDGDIIQLTEPKGNLKLHQLAPYRNFTFLAAGSGLTPFLNLIFYLLKRTMNRIEIINLLYFNQTESDIWCYKPLQKLQATDERFILSNILSKPSKDWTGLIGSISYDLLSTLICINSGSTIPTLQNTFVAICGPNGFNQQALDILSNLNFHKNDVHVF